MNMRSYQIASTPVATERKGYASLDVPFINKWLLTSNRCSSCCAASPAGFPVTARITEFAQRSQQVKHHFSPESEALL
jgi:hypothetical protein